MQINNLQFSYNKNVPIFKDFNFESDEKYIFFRGYSGCGKSTLLKLISQNLIPDDGIIRINNSDKVCLILQEDALFPWLNGIQNIKSILKEISDDEITNHSMFQYVKDFIHRKAFSLSYGQRRLIELFRAILYKPMILCLDEPFNYLDERSRQFVSDIIFSNDFFKETRQIVMTTHYDSDISSIKDINYSSYYFNGKMPYEKLEKRN